jgi:hypothetical protein
MRESEVVDILIAFISKQFPKECQCCGKRYNSLAEYIQKTTHIGEPISYDAEIGNWWPIKPLGTISLANCACGTTLIISSNGMNLFNLWKLMGWARKQTKIKGINMCELLDHLRKEIDKRALQNEEKLS